MMLYSLRNYIELAQIVAERGMSVEAMAASYGLSAYERKADLKNLAEMGPYFGLALRSTKDNVSFEVVNELLFREKRPELLRLNTRYSNNHKPSASLLLDCQVALYLLTRKDFTTIEEMADVFGYTRSSLRGKVKWARNYLKSYGVEVKSIPHYGLMTEPREFHKRVCILGTHSFIDPSLIIDGFQDPGYVVPDGPFYVGVGDILEEYFSEDHTLLFSPMGLQMVRKYLQIQSQRLANGFFIRFAGESFALDELGKSTEVRAASEILSRLYPGTPLPRDEVFSLAIIFLFHEEPIDLQTNTESSSFLGRFSQRAEVLLARIQSHMRQRYHMEITDPGHLLSARRALVRILTRDHFDILSAVGYTSAGREFSLSRDPVPILIGDELRALLSGELGREIPRSQLSELTDLVSRLIQSFPVYCQKTDIGILTNIRQIDSYHIRDRLRTILPPEDFAQVRILSPNSLEEAASGQMILITDTITDAIAETVPANRTYLLNSQMNDLGTFTLYLRNRRSITSAYLSSIRAFRAETLREALARSGLEADTFAQNRCIFCNDVALRIVFEEDTPCQISLFETVTPERTGEGPEIRDYTRFLCLRCAPRPDTLRFASITLKLLVNDPELYTLLLDEPSAEKLNVRLVPYF